MIPTRYQLKVEIQCEAYRIPANIPNLASILAKCNNNRLHFPVAPLLDMAMDHLCSSSLGIDPYYSLPYDDDDDDDYDQERSTENLSVHSVFGPNQGFRPFSFDDPFVNPSLEPRPLAPIDGDNNHGKSHSFAAYVDQALGILPDEQPPLSSPLAESFSGDEIMWSQPPSVLSFSSDTRADRFADSPQYFPLPKRRRSQQRACGDDVEEAAVRFGQHNDARWHQQFRTLLKFKEKSGHCCVPITCADDPILARWVKRQRYQYKRFQEGKASATDINRIQLLESIGFIWDAHAAAWQEKWNELAAFKRVNGHCDMPAHDPHNVQLSSWVKCQRRQYKLFQAGKPSHMSLQRINALGSLGFTWKSPQNKTDQR